MKSSTLDPFTFLATMCTCSARRQKCINVVSIHWFLLRNFDFFHHPQILCCFKAITKIRIYVCCIASHVGSNIIMSASLLIVSISWGFRCDPEDVASLPICPYVFGWGQGVRVGQYFCHKYGPVEQYSSPI